ncbi:hypothetical protein B0H14DRAFT_977569 [Mycena olivaceomarginata]|nr:hypothetical protein B0H14DRAFT_977569 [Mycena olivaceomarginata]
MNAIACRDTLSSRGNFDPSSSVETPSRRNLPVPQRRPVPSPLDYSLIFSPSPALSATGPTGPSARATSHSVLHLDPLRPRIAAFSPHRSSSHTSKHRRRRAASLCRASARAQFPINVHLVSPITFFHGTPFPYPSVKNFVRAMPRHSSFPHQTAAHPRPASPRPSRTRRPHPHFLAPRGCPRIPHHLICHKDRIWTRPPSPAHASRPHRARPIGCRPSRTSVSP